MGMEKYRVKANPRCCKESVVQGECYRISVLTPSLLRLEYAPDGIFEDRATQMVYNRDFPPVKFRTLERNGELELFTERLHLTYNQKEFSPNGLKISVAGGKGWGANWNYGDTLCDLLGTARTLDEADGPVPLEHGILSRAGFSVVDDSNTMVLTEDGFVAPRDGGKKDLYFFGYGHDYAQCMRDFYKLCGKTPLLPRYALGNWWSRYHKYTEEEYKELMERFEKEKLPFSVAVIDIDWHLVDIDPKYGTGWTGYTWNRDFFPDPKEFLDWLHEHDLKVTLNVHPADGIRGHEEAYEAVAQAMGIDPKTEEPVQFDPANPRFLEVYFDKVHHPLEDEGVDFWWVDWQQGNTTKIPGLDPLWMLNHYHYMDSRRDGKRGLTFSRYAGVGSHRYPVGFSGDSYITWESLDFQPYFTANASNVGYGWWSHDIGGHMGGSRDDELAARWVQFGVFSPINRLHSSNNDFNSKEPWRFGRNARITMEKFLRLRHEMIPYLYTMNRYASRDAQPLVRPLYWEEPENDICYELKNEYYFGTQMLVSPITRPEDREACVAETAVWLPKGIWFDFFTGTVYAGGRRIKMYRSLEDMPVLVKAGGIVPLAVNGGNVNDTSNPEHLKIMVFPAAEGSFSLWEDNDAAEDLDENWAETYMELKNEEDRSEFVIHPAKGNLSIIPGERKFTVCFRCVKEASVYVEGAKAAVSYDRKERTLTVELETTPVSGEIRIIAENGFLTAPNPMEEKIYDLLNNAQISYDLKAKAYDAVKQQKEAAVATILSLGLNRTLEGAIVEILNASVGEVL